MHSQATQKSDHVSQNTNDSVSEYVNQLVEKTVLTTSIQKEKETVQNLINGLVQRVRDDALDQGNKQLNSNTTSTDNIQSKSVPKQSTSTGVPTGDTRIWSIGSSYISFTQSKDSITFYLPVPAWVKKHHIIINFSPGGVNIIVNNQDGSPHLSTKKVFSNAVDPDGCMWMIEGTDQDRKLNFEMDKARIVWWPKLFMDDDPSDYHVVQEGANKQERDVNYKQTDNDSDSSKLSTSPKQSDISKSSSVNITEVNSSADTSNESDKNDIQTVVTNVIEDMIEKVTSDSESSKEIDITPDKSSDEPTNSNPSQRVLTRADIPRIIEQYKTTIAKKGPGASDAALQLATFYHHGIGIAKNDIEAARLYRFALENGSLDPSAAFQLGLIYNQGTTGMEPNPTEAVRWWKVSATLGNPVAMFNLGVMFMNGSGCDMDPVTATRWFQQAQALNPQLQPPRFSRAQLEERIATAMRLKKEKMRRQMSPEEKAKRKELAMKNLKMVGYGTVTLIGITATVMALRHWWRNRL